MTKIVRARIVKFFLALSFIAFIFGLVASTFSGTLTVTDLRVMPPQIYTFDGTAFFQSIFLVKPSTFMLLSLCIFFVGCIIYFLICIKLSDEELKKIGESDSLFTKIRTISDPEVQSEIRKMLPVLAKEYKTALKAVIIPGYLFQKTRVLDARVVKKIDPNKEQMSFFGGHYIVLEVNRYRDIQSLYNKEDTIRSCFIRVSKRLYNHLYSGASLKVFCQYNRHYSRIAKMSIAH